MVVMRVGSCIRYGPSATVVTLLLLAAMVLCVVHVDTMGADDLCGSFGPLVGPVAFLLLVPLGQSHVAPVTAYQAVAADLSPPPPEV